MKTIALIILASTALYSCRTTPENTDSLTKIEVELGPEDGIRADHMKRFFDTVTEKVDLYWESNSSQASGTFKPQFLDVSELARIATSNDEEIAKLSSHSPIKFHCLKSSITGESVSYCAGISVGEKESSMKITEYKIGNQHPVITLSPKVLVILRLDKKRLELCKVTGFEADAILKFDVNGLIMKLDPNNTIPRIKLNYGWSFDYPNKKCVGRAPKI